MGGNLDLSGNTIDGTGGINITGVITATNVSVGQSVTASNFYGDGSGLVNVPGTGGLSNVVEDETPQLGGDLDLNGKTINGSGGINITGVITATSFSGAFNGDGSGLTGISADPPVGIDTSGTSEFNNINATGVITATSYYGDASNLTGITASTASKSIVSDKSTQSSLAVYASHSETSNSAYDLSLIHI